MDSVLKMRGPRACATCAKAKARCLPAAEGEKCERCNRLNKSCSSQTPAPPRQRKDPKPTKVAELERRLEDLTTRIETVHRQQQPTGPKSDVRFQRGYNGPSHPFGHLFPNDPSVDVDMDDASTSPSAGETVDPPPRMLTPPRSSVSDPKGDAITNTTESFLWPQPAEAEALMTEYRVHLAHLFPFVVVPPHVTTGQLRELRPFLWRAIMVAACQFDGPRQIALGAQLLKEIAEAAITRPRRSIDLLQGLQVLISWYHYNLNSFQTTNLLYLARSICASLGFNESQRAATLQEHTPSSLEQMRAFAGVYYMVTLVFTTNKKPDALMNTSALETCCRVLEERMEYPSDELLVHLVRAQQLAQSISLTLAFRNSNIQGVDLPQAIIVKSFQQQIETFQNSLPQHIRENPTMAGHIYVAEILLYELGIHQDGWQQQLLAPTDRLELLWACLGATKGFLTNRFARTTSQYPRFTCMSSFDFVYAFLTCLKLITLEAPGWDLQIVRRQLPLDELIDRQVEHMEQVANQRKGRGRDDSRGDSGNASGNASGAVHGRNRCPLEYLVSSMSGGASPSSDLSTPTSSTSPTCAGPDDPFARLANKLRMLKEAVRFELDNVFPAGGGGAEGETHPTSTPASMSTSVSASASAPASTSATTAATTPAEIPSLELATQDIIHDLDGSLWQDLISGHGWEMYDNPVDGWML